MITDEFFERRNVIDPSGIVQVYKNYWWWCEGDATRALFFVRGRSGRDLGAPQCNHTREIALSVGEKMGYDTWAQLVQIPLAFVPWIG